MNKTILITGASGLIGKPLTNLLLEKGYLVHHLTHSSSTRDPRIRTFKWDVDNRKIDENCIEGVDTIIHLAGEGIAERPWTKKRKNQIVESRTESIRLIYDLLKKKTHQVKTVVSASAVGYYGDRNNELLTEETPPGKDFLSRTCIAWEQAVDEGQLLNLRTVKLRTGLLLARQGGALPQLARPVKAGFGAPFGSGNQWFPWIYMDDVLRMYLFAIENDRLHGAYNMTAPRPVTNKEFIKELAVRLNKPLWLPKIPGFLLRIILGEMSTMLLNSTNTSPGRICSEGFEFNFPELPGALKNIYALKA